MARAILSVPQLAMRLALTERYSRRRQLRASYTVLTQSNGLALGISVLALRSARTRISELTSFTARVGRPVLAPSTARTMTTALSGWAARAMHPVLSFLTARATIRHSHTCRLGTILSRTHAPHGSAPAFRNSRCASARTPRTELTGLTARAVHSVLAQLTARSGSSVLTMASARALSTVLTTLTARALLPVLAASTARRASRDSRRLRLALNNRHAPPGTARVRRTVLTWTTARVGISVLSALTGSRTRLDPRHSHCLAQLAVSTARALISITRFRYGFARTGRYSRIERLARHVVGTRREHPSRFLRLAPRFRYSLMSGSRGNFGTRSIDGSRRLVGTRYYDGSRRKLHRNSRRDRAINSVTTSERLALSFSALADQSALFGGLVVPLP